MPAISPAATAVNDWAAADLRLIFTGIPPQYFSIVVSIGLNNG